MANLVIFILAFSFFEMCKIVKLLKAFILNNFVNHKFNMIVNVVLNKLKFTNAPYILCWHQSQRCKMDRDSKTSKFHRQILKETIQDFKHFYRV